VWDVKIAHNLFSVFGLFQHGVKMERPADFSIVEGLGGFVGRIVV
jgi:hypothetical protein